MAFLRRLGRIWQRVFGAGRRSSTPELHQYIDRAQRDNIDSLAVVVAPVRAGSTTAPDPAIGGRGPVHLAAWARDIEAATATADDPRFLFGPLQRAVDALLVNCGTPGILPNAFTAAWIGSLLADRDIRCALVRGGETVDDEQTDAELLCRWLPDASLHREDRRSVRIQGVDDIAAALPSLPTAYPFFHRAYDGFRERLRDLGWSDDTISPAFMYAMVGTSRNSFLLEQMARRYAWGPSPNIVDFGGGFGFLGLELAAKGWTATVVDNDSMKTERMGPWLRDRSPRPLPVSFRTASIDDIPEAGIPGTEPLHVISFIHSLLAAERLRVADILRVCWHRLAPGGALVIHELVHGAQADLPAHAFHRDELLRLVADNATRPTYSSIQYGKPLRKFVPRRRPLIVARRPP